jgi:hypothetical protein
LETAIVGPYSRRTSLAKIDGRTREAKLMREVEAELTKHVGGKPSVTQQRLIERIAWLTLRMEMLDRAVLARGEMNECDSRTYLAWSNSLSRALRDLGLKPTTAAPQSLRDYVAEKKAVR